MASGKEIKIRDKGFLSGMLYCIQDLVLTYDSPTIAEEIMLSSHIPHEEFIEAQKLTGYRDKIMYKFFKEAFNKEPK